MDSKHTISQRRTDIKQKAGTMFRLNDYYKNLLFCDFLEYREFRRIVNGAGDRGRTDTVSLPRDFESRTSANSITPATAISIILHSFQKIKCFFIFINTFL